MNTRRTIAAHLPKHLPIFMHAGGLFPALPVGHSTFTVFPHVATR